ncbi:MAG: hypothetical protein JKY52_09615 [Flavobacteriales bacterium]|nr:hypothetical protein [Flavobacteriales bacterium]
MEYVFDIEANGLKPDKIYCVVATNEAQGLFGFNGGYGLFFNGLTEEDYLVGHNIVCYDMPVLEKLAKVKTKAKLVDTLALSWYLYPKRVKHGLADWGEEFGIPKPKIDNWDDLEQEEYLHRCKEDVKINTLLWEKMKKDLEAIYGEDGYWGLIEYLTFKMDCMREQEENPWYLDIDGCEKLVEELQDKQEVAKEDLEAAMPPVTIWKKKKRPKEPYKKDGTLSVIGKRWQDFCKINKVPFETNDIIEYSDGSAKPPNAGAHQQVKDWLFSLDWSPMSFKYVDDGVNDFGKRIQRAIPQIKDGDGNLCKSIERMIESYPQLEHLKELGVLSHRIGMLNGFLRGVDEDARLVAGCQGLTNTLRFKHRTCVNIPSGRKPYGASIRGLLTCPSGFELVGSDMSSLEDRTKQHYMWPLDEDYVKDMMGEDFDPHLDMGLVSGTMSVLQCKEYRESGKWGDLRYDNKQINYSATYGVSADGVVRNTGMAKEKATMLLKAFWERNWSIKAIAAEQETKTIGDMTWMFNPVSKIWYWLKTEKDRFSTLNQGTGTYCFDMWVKELRGRGVKVSAQFHDEVVCMVKKGYREQVTKDFKESVYAVNKLLRLNRDLDVDVQFGDNYSTIH